MKTINLLNLKKLFGFFLFLFASAGLMAQANFTGTWGFNESKSNFGDSQFRFAASSLVIAQEVNNLTVERTRPGRDGGETKTNEKYTLDGQVCENPAFNNSIRKTIVTWSEDKTALTLASTMKFEMNGETTEWKSSEIWKLAEGGKVLMIESSFSTPNGDIKSTLAYDKK
jgi:hypothetical protein